MPSLKRSILMKFMRDSDSLTEGALAKAWRSLKAGNSPDTALRNANRFEAKAERAAFREADPFYKAIQNQIDESNARATTRRAAPITKRDPSRFIYERKRQGPGAHALENDRALDTRSAFDDAWRR